MFLYVCPSTIVNMFIRVRAWPRYQSSKKLMRSVLKQKPTHTDRLIRHQKIIKISSESVYFNVFSFN